MGQPFHAGQTGFSLIEAMVAAMVVGVGMLGLARLQSSFIGSNGESRVHTAALHFAQQKMEMWRGFSTLAEYGAALGAVGSPLITGSDSCDPLASVALASGCPIGINAMLSRDWTIVDCGGALACRKVTLTVTWTAPDATTPSLVLTAFIPRTESVDAGVTIAP